MNRLADFEALRASTVAALAHHFLLGAHGDHRLLGLLFSPLLETRSVGMQDPAETTTVRVTSDFWSRDMQASGRRHGF